MSILRRFLRQDFADPFSMCLGAAGGDRLCFHPGNPPRQFVPVDLIKHVRVMGRADSRGLFDEVTRPSAFGQTGIEADIAEWPTLTRMRHRRASRVAVAKLVSASIKVLI
jgi:hypothetical protein